LGAKLSPNAKLKTLIEKGKQFYLKIASIPSNKITAKKWFQKVHLILSQNLKKKTFFDFKID
jgi:hypothetical protein